MLRFSKTDVTKTTSYVTTSIGYENHQLHMDDFLSQETTAAGVLLIEHEKQRIKQPHI